MIGLKLATCVRERDRDRDEGCKHRLAEDCYINLLLTHVENFVFRALCLCFFTEMFSTGFCRMPPGPCSFWIFAVHCLNLFWLWLTVGTCVAMPSGRTSGCQTTQLFSCLHSWNILFRDPYLKGLSMFNMQQFSYDCFTSYKMFVFIQSNRIGYKVKF